MHKFSGIAGTVDVDNGASLLQHAAEQDDVVAQLLRMAIGQSIADDSAKSMPNPVSMVEAVRRLAQKRDIMAAFVLGMAADQGVGQQANPAYAARCWQWAAEKGCLESLNQWASLLMHGRGVPKDEPAAALAWRLVAKSGDAHAMFALSTVYLYGYPSRRRSRRCITDSTASVRAAAGNFDEA